MKMNEGIKKYRLPNPATPENLEMRFSAQDGKVLTYGDKVLVAGYYWDGPNKPTYYAAIYEFLDEGRDYESVVGLREVSDVAFPDDGHAIAWAMQQ